MYVDEERCKPQSCDLECVDACKRIHTSIAPLTFDNKTGYPVIDEQKCTKCLSCIRACPTDAIVQFSQKEKGTKTPEDNVKPVDKKPPYSVSDEYTPFPEKDNIFARVINDESFSCYKQSVYSKAHEMIGKDLPGYSRIEHELVMAAWKLYDSKHTITPAVAQPLQERGQIHGNWKAITEFVKKAAKFFGADLVGVTDLDRNWLYSTNRKGEPYDIPEEYDTAIVMAIEMDYEGINTSPAMPCSAASVLGYSKMAFVEIILSAFINRLGYGAIPCGNDVGLSVPMAIDAGLGQYGRHGLLITEEYGPRVRLCKVLTDMPLQTDQPDTEFCESVIRFCEVCEKCAEHCPSQSIPYGPERTWSGETPSNNPGIFKWYVDVESCYEFWVENGGDCSNCIRSCPYNREPGVQLRIIHWITKHIPKLNGFLVNLDDLLGHGLQQDPEKAWEQYE
ncbi:MAG: reductive dehalogenase [Candidatus Thorarchaeota archaeon]|nr:reductive dehalogenase [Candidatus Thorarchaeota archaeon]